MQSVKDDCGGVGKYLTIFSPNTTQIRVFNEVMETIYQIGFTYDILSTNHHTQVVCTQIMYATVNTLFMSITLLFTKHKINISYDMASVVFGQTIF